MTNQTVGMGEQGQAERDKFENELKRILEASDKAGILLRVIGSLAFQMHACVAMRASPPPGVARWPRAGPAAAPPGGGAGGGRGAPRRAG